MKRTDINIRDPFVVPHDGKYYLYGTRGENFGRWTGGFDVYVSEDLENWSEPHECFDSAAYGMNTCCNWAPEVHEYKGAYYMFATFTNAETGMKGTHILRSESLMGPFVPHSKGSVTPQEWEALDGTLYVSREGVPYMAFSNEHVQILDGTVCYVPLKEDLTDVDGEIVTLFHASEGRQVDPIDEEGKRFVTDGPFLHRTKAGELIMIWSSFIGGNYAVYPVRFAGGELGTDFSFLDPIVTADGGHGMIFRAGDRLLLSLHSPNRSLSERPHFLELEENENGISVK